MSVDEAFHEIEKVKGFIKSGGVTVSGGEPLMQAKFVLNYLKNVKKTEFTLVWIPMDICLMMILKKY